MSTIASAAEHLASYPVGIRAEPAIEGRNRLTTFFRLFLALPHLVLVGGPVSVGLSLWGARDGNDWMAGGGVLGAVAAVAALIAWFAIVFNGKHPTGLWNLAAFYLRWRVRAIAYTALLRDEYPPFGDDAYPVELRLTAPAVERDRLTVAFRIFLALPQLIVVWVLTAFWALLTVVAWVSILLTGRYPRALYEVALGILRWNVRVEAYVLLLEDRYPPFGVD